MSEDQRKRINLERRMQGASNVSGMLFSLCGKMVWFDTARQWVPETFNFNIHYT